MKKYMPTSIERTELRMEPSPKHQSRSVPVVYYLCRNRRLEHPHFMEVPLSSPGGLYLRDVIERLNVLRGRDMPSMYSWSCKRGYKNGFVWQDLCEDDLIFPAHGNEYVLKGSALCEEFHSDYYVPDHVQSGSNTKLHNAKQLQEPTSSRKQEAYLSSLSMVGKETKPLEEGDFSTLFAHPGSCGMSPDSSVGKNPSRGSSRSLTEYNVYKGGAGADASTQTEESGGKTKAQENYTRGVSTGDGPSEFECKENHQNQVPQEKDNSQICRDEISPPSSSSTSSGRTETLESLIRANPGKINSFRIIEEEEVGIPLKTNSKTSNVLLQLISCGSISANDHRFGLIPTYRPRFSHSKFPSVTLGELNCLSENPKLMGLRLEDKDYFCGSLTEIKTLKGGYEFTAFKRSSSCNSDGICKSSNSTVEKVNDTDSARSKCIPRSIKASLSKHSRSGTIRSPVSQGPRNSCAGADNSEPMPLGVSSNGSSKRISQPSSGKRWSKRQDSLREEKVIQIEERLSSGARVIIQSKAPCGDGSSSFDL